MRRVSPLVDHALVREQVADEWSPAILDGELPVAVSALEDSFPIFGCDLHDFLQLTASNHDLG